MLNIKKERELLIGELQGGEREYNKILKRNDNSDCLAIMQCRRELFKNRHLNNELQLKDIEEHYQEHNEAKLKNDFGKLDLIYKTESDMKFLLHIIASKKLLIKDIYNQYLNGCNMNLVALVS